METFDFLCKISHYHNRNIKRLKYIKVDTGFNIKNAIAERLFIFYGTSVWKRYTWCMNPQNKKYNIFLGIGILLCATICIFLFLGKKTQVSSSNFKEWNDVYNRAYRNGITTISDIKDANVDWPVYRKSAAKMTSIFAMKIFGRTPDERIKCIFKDSSKEDSELQNYIQLSCKLWIMGVDYYGNPDTTFNPNYIVTRDQFVTILSRILFGNTYNIKPGELTFYDKSKNFVSHCLSNISTALGINLNITPSLDRYTKHMDAIKKLWVMTDYTPTMKEFRWSFMFVMYKLDKIKQLIKQ